MIGFLACITVEKDVTLKKEILDLMNCPKCHAALSDKDSQSLTCTQCGYSARMIQGIPLFTDVPATIEPWEKVERGPDKGTAWRKSNWKFLNAFISKLPSEAKILDVGAGHGDFADIFEGRRYYLLDIVPYPEVDLVADLGEVNPFKDGVFDVVVLMNVLEHVYESCNLLKSIARIVADDGSVVITVPFLLKVHQAPFDFARYTPFFIEKMAADAGLKVESLQGYYDTQYLLNESLGNAWQYSVNTQSKPQQLTAKFLVFIIQRLVNWFGKITRKGFIATTQSQPNPAPVGYLVVLRKKD
jgi:SAM-dependent methyltransferase